MNYDTIIVIDYGSQYSQLIVRRIRELGVYSELLLPTISTDELKSIPNLKGILLSGGPSSVYQKDAPSLNMEWLDLGIPVLGICYGMQLLVHLHGGTILQADHQEYGKMDIQQSVNISHLFDTIPEQFNVFMSHGDQVAVLPEGFAGMASSQTCTYAAIVNPEKKLYGVQFHPEVQHTEYGIDLLKNFIFLICEAKANWTMKHYITDKIQEIRSTVQNQFVVCGLSGGVDSAVAALLIHQAIKNQLLCIFVDHGLLRKGEFEQVKETFTNHFNITLKTIDAKKRFLEKLSGVTDPEQKRIIIGHEFVRVFEEEAKKAGTFHFLAQGTLYTDKIESGTKTAHKIKSHHNVGGLPKDMSFLLLEPLDMLFKDEVRKLGEELGLDKKIVWRQPFPGPGLAIRIMGEVTEEKLEIVRESDFILRQEIAKANLEKEVWQYFTVLTGVHTVGVMGDKRTYGHTIAIRAVTSQDGMTADWAKIPMDVLDRIARRIVNEVAGVNRIVYDITSKPPSTIEWE